MWHLLQVLFEGCAGEATQPVPSKLSVSNDASRLNYVVQVTGCLWHGLILRLLMLKASFGISVGTRGTGYSPPNFKKHVMKMARFPVVLVKIFLHTEMCLTPNHLNARHLQQMAV